MISRLLHYHLGTLSKGCFAAIIILIGSGCSILEVADETANWTVEDLSLIHILTLPTTPYL